MRRHDLERLAKHETVTLQMLERLGQHPLADPADLALELTEPQGAGLQRHQHQYAPAAGHVIEHLARGAGRRHQVSLQVAVRDDFGQRAARSRSGGIWLFHTYLNVRTYEK